MGYGCLWSGIWMYAYVHLCKKMGYYGFVVFLCCLCVGFCVIWSVHWLYRVFSELLVSRSIICTLPCTDSHLLFDLTSVVLFGFVFFVGRYRGLFSLRVTLLWS